MSELSLYRKYRPKAFKEVLGQDHIISVLEGAIKNNNISHAYLFSGSRGTGKTSVARILARELGTSANDIYEIDAASNRGIDEVRALREAVNILPLDSKYKVYIIDEVHMMTKDAFNALLKTLEEPPKHVIFILATTEPEKLLETIISRCQWFKFNRPSRFVLKEMVLLVSKKEGYKLNTQARDLIAFLGDGSFRDTHGILQKVISASVDKEITEKEVLLATGAPDRQFVDNFLKAVIEKDGERGFKIINQIVSSNFNIKLFIRFLAEKVRQAILLKISKKTLEDIYGVVLDEELAFLTEISKNKALDSAFLKRILDCYLEVDNFYAPEISLELLLSENLNSDNKE